MTVYKGHNAIILKAGIEIGIAKDVRIDIDQGLEVYFEAGSLVGSKVKEGPINIIGRISKAWIDTNYLDLLEEDPLSDFTLLLRTKKCGPFLYCYNCKFFKLDLPIPQDGFLMENYDFRAKNAAAFYVPGYPIDLRSRKNDYSEVNEGDISLDSDRFPLPHSMEHPAGTFPIKYFPEAQRYFHGWEFSGGIDVPDYGANPSNVTITSGGELKAIFGNSPLPPECPDGEQIVNGDFEDIPFPSWPAAPPPHWTGWGVWDFGLGHSGSQSVEFLYAEEEEGGGWLEQDIETEIGHVVPVDCVTVFTCWIYNEHFSESKSLRFTITYTDDSTTIWEEAVDPDSFTFVDLIDHLVAGKSIKKILINNLSDSYMALDDVSLIC